MHGERIRIKMLAYDHEIIDQAARQIVETAKASGAKVSGPIPLPTNREVYTVLRSPHVDKKSRSQFEIRTHKRLIYIYEITAKTVGRLEKISMPAGIDVRLRSISD